MLGLQGKQDGIRKNDAFMFLSVLDPDERQRLGEIALFPETIVQVPGVYFPVPYGKAGLDLSLLTRPHRHR